MENNVPIIKSPLAASGAVVPFVPPLGEVLDPFQQPVQNTKRKKGKKVKNAKGALSVGQVTDNIFAALKPVKKDGKGKKKKAAGTAAEAEPPKKTKQAKKAAAADTLAEAVPPKKTKKAMKAADADTPKKKAKKASDGDTPAKVAPAKKWEKPHISVEASRSRVRCRDGKGGSWSYSFTEHGEKQAMKWAKEWLASLPK